MPLSNQKVESKELKESKEAVEDLKNFRIDDLNFKILDFLAKVPVFFTLSTVSKSYQRSMHQYVQVHCSVQIQTLCPGIQKIWKDLSAIEKIRLHAPMTIRFLNAVDLSKRSFTYHRVLTGGSYDTTHFTRLQQLGLKVGLSYKEVSTETFLRNFENKHAYAISFCNLYYENIKNLRGRQIDFAMNGYNPKVVVGLTDLQLEGIEVGLTREEVTIPTFSKMHVLAKKKGLQYEELKKLKDFQIEALILGLTHKEVQEEGFSKWHVEAIKQGFHYCDIAHLWGEITARSIITKHWEKLQNKEGFTHIKMKEDGLYSYGSIMHDSYNSISLKNDYYMLQEFPVDSQAWYIGSQLYNFVQLWKDRLHVLHFTPSQDVSRKDKKSESEKVKVSSGVGVPVTPQFSTASRSAGATLSAGAPAAASAVGAGLNVQQTDAKPKEEHKTSSIR